VKIRTGFVSNSSSSSFVIKIKDLTIEQMEKLSQEDSFIIRNGCVQSISGMEHSKARWHLEQLGIDMELVQWVCVDLATLLGR